MEREQDMNTKNLIKLTTDIIQKYYNNEVQPFLDYMDENVMWYGPAKGQFLIGRDTAVKAWDKENNPLTFTIGSIKIDHVTSHPAFCEIMASYTVITHYPSGADILVEQISHFTWCERKVDGYSEKQPRMLVIHISNQHSQHKEDTIYPVHFDKIIANNEIPAVHTSERIYFHGLDHSDYYLMADSIFWIESSDSGRHSILHTFDDNIRVNTTISQITCEHPDLFLRCHRCYLVNPEYITQISRFKVTMADKAELPIPEKKYTAFKKAAKDYLECPKGIPLPSDYFKKRLS